MREATSRMLNVLVLLLIASTANSQSSQPGRNQLKCEESSSCTCIEYNEIEIQCPKFEPHVFVRIQSNNYVHFECENITGNEFEMVPKYKLDVVPLLQITKCSLMPGTSIIKSYLKNIQIDRIRTFQFVSSGANKNIPIESQHFRDLGDIERFDLRGMEDEIKELPSDLFVGMTKLSWVRIRVAKISLPDDLFAPLENMEFLELGHNKLETLPPRFLRNQRKLVQLNLWGNALKNLNKESFVGLDLVRELDLSANGMESLESDLFFHLTNLTDINLSANNFASLPEDLFSNNKKLKFVRLIENRVAMKTLPKRLFANQTELTTIAIKAGLQTLPEDIFEGSENILSLKLEQNSLDNLPADLFKDQKNLEKLDLHDNLISDLHENFFLGTISLKELKLTRNRLTAIKNYVFKPLSKLTHLYLNKNQIKTIEPLAFIGNKMLEFLTLQDNQIVLQDGEYPQASPFQNLRELENLNLGNNSITEIFEDFTLESLKYLNLSANQISVLTTNDLNNLQAKNIDLTYNQIHEINFNFEINQTVHVYLDHNPIECDCVLHKFIKHLKGKNGENATQKITIGDLSCAKPESLADMRVADLDPFLLVCPLDNAGTSRKKCPEGCQCEVRPEDNHALVVCDSSVDFSSLPVAGQSATELIVANNNLTKLPTIQSPGYALVTHLNVTGNQLIEIFPENLPPRLTKLDLSDNQLETLNETVRLFIGNISSLEISLDRNPWLCDCNNKGFVSFVKKLIKENKVKYEDDVICANGRAFKDIDEAKLCSENENLFIMILCIITAVMGLTFGGLAALYYKYQKQIKMWLYSHNMLLWFVTEEELDKDKRYDAFVSYSHRDNDFVADYLLPELENGTIPYKLCVHERDWSPGLEISTQISNSVNDAKRTIIVMSPNYLQSNWAQWEFRVAQSHAATEKRSRIIVILYGDIGDINKLEPDIRDYLKLNTYVKWGDKWFWEKLKYAMPHVKSNERVEKGKGLVKSAIKSSVDDKLELIKPISVTPPQLTTPPAEKVANPLITSLNAKNAANQNGKAHNGYNGHINGAFVINTSSRQSDV